MDGRRTLRQIVEALDRLMETQGLAALCGTRTAPPFLARPRTQEIFACLNRFRSLNLS